MRIECKIYREGVNCSVCGDKVQNLYALHELKDEGDGICGRCMCNHLIHSGYNVTSGKKVRVTERSDAECPECGAQEILVYVKSNNPLSIATYYVGAICGHCGKIFKIGEIPDNAFSEIDEDTGVVTIVPMDDCMIEVKWSIEHERLVGIIRDIPCRD